MIGGFTLISENKRKWGNVSEDSLKYKEKGEIYLAVADGVSRDPFNNYPNISTEKGKILMARNYPKPSLAKKTADIAVKAGDLYQANKKIAALNRRKVPDPNWLKEDLAGCTASLAYVKEDTLYYQFIACCGVGVVDKNGRVKFQTQDEYWTTDKERWRLVGKAEFIKGFDQTMGEKNHRWNYPEGRFLMRRFFRNKPRQKYSFGVLTGEKEAEHYIRKGIKILNDGDVVLVYTDGLRKALFSRDCLELISSKEFSKLEKYCSKNVDSEGTLVFWTRN